MREKVIQYLLSDRSFAGGVALYNSLPGRSLAFQRQLNNRGNAPGMLQHLHYELAKLVGINEPALQGYLSRPLQAVAVAKESLIESQPSLSQKLKAALEADDYNELRALVAELDLEAAGRKKEDLRTALEAKLQEEEEEAALAQLPPMPKPVEQASKLRSRFPILKDKDCPPELKILVADRISAYQRYVEAHQALFKDRHEAAIAANSKEVVESFIENRLIFEELEHYQQNGKPLGLHPIWEARQELDSLRSLSAKELANKHNSLKKGISTDKKKIAAEQALEAPDGKKIESWQKALAKKEFLQEEVNRLLESIGN